MAKLQAKKIAASIQKAQQIGVVEESFAICGCQVVLRSLNNPEYQAAMSAISELEDINYAVGYRVEHLSRSIVEIDGVSLRDVDFVEIDVEDPKTHQVGTEVLERSDFIRDYILASWGREAVDAAFRKFSDVVAKAEQASSRGIVFDTKEETAEESYRRLLAEAKEVEGGVPFEIATRIRDEFGYLLKQEWANLEQRATKEEDVAEEAPLSAPVLPPERPEPPAPVASTDLIMRRPAAPTPAQQSVVAPAPVQQPMPVIPPMGAPQVVAPMKRSSEIEELEAVTGIDQGELGVTPELAYNPHSVTPRTPPRDPETVQKIIDQPPVGGINPRFKKRY